MAYGETEPAGERIRARERPGHNKCGGEDGGLAIGSLSAVNTQASMSIIVPGV